MKNETTPPLAPIPVSPKRAHRPVQAPWAAQAALEHLSRPAARKARQAVIRGACRAVEALLAKASAEPSPGSARVDAATSALRRLMADIDARMAFRAGNREKS